MNCGHHTMMMLSVLDWVLQCSLLFPSLSHLLLEESIWPNDIGSFSIQSPNAKEGQEKAALYV